MKDERLQMGVISYAHPHAAKYAAEIFSAREADLAGIAALGINSDHAASEADRYGVPFYEDYRALLSLVDLDAVYLGSEPSLHVELTKEVASNQKHLLCDKPIATSLEDADRIIRFADEAGIKLMVPFNPRYQLPVMKAKAALENPETGDLVSIHAIKYGKLPTDIPGNADYRWLLDSNLAGGGGFLDIGIHAIDAVRWLANSEVRRVYANISASVHPDLTVDDLGSMTIEFENDVVSYVSAGWANPSSYPEWLDVRFEILTTEQSILIDSPYHGYWSYGPAGVERSHWWRRDVQGMLHEFIQAILEDRQPTISGEDARAALAIALAAYESARTGDVVEL